MRCVRVVAAVAMLCLSACAHDGEVRQIVVYQGEGNLVRTVSEAPVVAAVQRAWADKERVLLKVRPEFAYRIEVKEVTGVSVWLYNPAGFTTLADKPLEPIYRIREYAEINQLLGVAR